MKTEDAVEALVESVLAGNSRAIARAMSLVENEAPAGVELLRAIYPRTGRAYVVGVTGAPGAGKSTLVDRLIATLRGRGSTVGVLAVDPTSPFSGGAVLGDRVRMQTHARDAGVFIRSMATRGHLGGVARATSDAASVLDAAGKDIIIIETVGVGQAEVDIVRAADVCVVTLVPGTGDDVQALKAGIMEIADVFVVNKADREGSEQLVSAIEGNLSLHSYGRDEWRPPIVKTIATTGVGVTDVLQAVDAFRAHAAGEHAARRRASSEYRLRDLVSGRFLDYLEREVLKPGELSVIVDRIASRSIDPYTAAESLLKRAIEQPANRPGEQSESGNRVIG